MRTLTRIAALVVLGAGLAQAASERIDAAGPVIPPGQEELLVEMLGRSAALPDDCALTEGRTERRVVHAHYACGLGEVVLQLSHPGQAADGATRTEQFALTVYSGSVPPGLLAAVAARVRAREADFEWLWPDDVALPELPGAVGAGVDAGEPRW